MGKHPISKRAVCPYYKAHQRQEIFCEGIQESTRIHLGFSDPATLDTYKHDKCESEDWKSCPIADMLNRKYDYK